MLAACRRWRAKHCVHLVFDLAKCSVSFEADAADTIDAFLRSVGLADSEDVEEFFLEDHDAPTEHGEPEPEADVTNEADVDGLEAERDGYITDPEVTPEEGGTGKSDCGFDGGEDGCGMTDDEMWVPLYAPFRQLDVVDEGVTAGGDAWLGSSLAGVLETGYVLEQATGIVEQESCGNVMLRPATLLSRRLT